MLRRHFDGYKAAILLWTLGNLGLVGFWLFGTPVYREAISSVLVFAECVMVLAGLAITMLASWAASFGKRTVILWSLFALAILCGYVILGILIENG